MSQDSEWAALYLIAGAFLAVVGGIWQTLWQERRQIRRRLEDCIEEIQLKIDWKDSEFSAKILHTYTVNRLTQPIRKMLEITAGSGRVELKEQWGKYRRLENKPDSITRKDTEKLIKTCESYTDDFFGKTFKRICRDMFS